MLNVLCIIELTQPSLKTFLCRAVQNKNVKLLNFRLCRQCTKPTLNTYARFQVVFPYFTLILFFLVLPICPHFYLENIMLFFQQLIHGQCKMRCFSNNDKTIHFLGLEFNWVASAFLLPTSFADNFFLSRITTFCLVIFLEGSARGQLLDFGGV